MNRSLWVLFVIALTAAARGEAPSNAAKSIAERPIREIFVPFEDLNVILDNDHQRVFLTRDEYEELIKQAKSKPHKPAPHKVALVAAQYQGELFEGRALIRGKLTIEVMEEGLFELPLDLAGVGIRSATLDRTPAPLFLGGSNRPTLLIRGPGLHQLEIELTAPLQTAAAQQTLQITLPTQAATRLNLSVPGNVEVKGGAAVVSRTYDLSADRTRLEILPPKGGMAIAMSLNNRLIQEQRVIVARSVIVDEITQGYERIHATVSCRVLHGAVDKLRLVVPEGFDVMKVESALLSRWEEKNGDGRKVLETTLREPSSEQVVLHLTFNRSPSADAAWLVDLATWKFPRLEILDTAGHVAVLGLVVEDRLKLENIETSNLVPIDSTELARAIPASVLKAEPGAPVVRQVTSYYAPAGDYRMSAKFVRPPAELKVAGNSLVIIGDAGLTLQGGFALTPLAESLFEFSFALPAGWQVTQVTAMEGQHLPLERYLLPGGGTRALVRLPRGVPIGQTQVVNYQATFTPSSWLTDWMTQTIEIPKVHVAEGTSEGGAIAVQTVDDLVARPDAIDGLIALLDNEKSSFGLAGIPITLAYRYEHHDYSSRFIVERMTPSLAARVMSFLKLERDNLVAHYELTYDVREARIRQAAFTLPIGTPTELNILGLEYTTVKQFHSEEQDGRRLWTVQLGQRQSGSLRLAIDFTQRLPVLAQQNADLPLIQAAEVTYQSGLVAIEGDAELDVSVKTTARAVDIGELSGAEYSLGRRVIGSFGYVGTGPSFQAAISYRSPFTLPPALVQRAELITKVAASGLAQSVARYDLLTKATLLEIRLPADSTLWTIYLDDQPTKPQRENESLLLSLPAQEQVSARKLQIVYESAISPLGISGAIDTSAPQLLVRSEGNETEREIPQADLQWQLFLPNGYAVRHSGGTVEADGVPPREMAALKVMRFLYELSGGVRPSYHSAEANRLSSIRGAFDGVDLHSRAAQSDSGPVPVSAEPATVPMAARELRLEQKLAESPERLAAQSRSAARLKDDANLPIDKSESGRKSIRESTKLGRDVSLGFGVVAGQDRDTKRLWALQGVSTLKIELEPDSGLVTTFHSLGRQPELSAIVIDERRITAGALGLVGLVFLFGVGLTFHSARNQATYVALVLLASTVPPLLTAYLDNLGLAFDYVFFAGCALAVYYPLAALIFAIARRIMVRLPSHASQELLQLGASVLIVLALSAVPASTVAQAPHLPEDTKPVSIPADAIIVPYDPDKPDGREAAEKILVPYAKYVELWNQANPGKKIDITPPPVGYAIAGTTYEMALAAGDFLSLVGRMEIEVYSDNPVAVPLALVGGVLEKATVDGQAARLQMVEQQADAAANQPKTGAQSRTATPTSRLLLLHLSGKGRKLVELRIRLGLARQGGWRIARGQVPVGPAAALTVIVPDAGTEIRQMSLADRSSFETKAPGERIESSLLANGQVNLQWRPKIGEGMVDQALTARSTAAFDIREDSLRLTWQVHLDFGRIYRDAFSLNVPDDYLVESVIGDNVRGWAVKQLTNQQRIDVTLLKPVQSSENLTVQMARRGRVGEGSLAEFDAPVVLVEGAALEHGDIVVRKSPRLDLRILSSNGLSRADSNRQTTAIEQLADAADAAVLVVRPYQTFSFARPHYRLTLSAGELLQEATAEVRAALRITERQTTLDAAIIFRPHGAPLYGVRLYLPDGFALDRLSPADLEWSITNDNGRQLLTVQLLDGRTSDFTLALFGKLSTPTGRSAEAPETWSTLVPRVQVLDVQKQSGEIVVLPDSDTDVRLDNLRNAEAAPLTTAPAWMSAAQQPLAKAVLRYRTTDYAGTVNLTPRTPVVSARTVTNIKITPRSIEETVLLNFRIERAGVRSITFLLPDHLAKARLKAPLVKQQSVAPATNAAGQSVAGMVRISLELQDFVRGDYAVLLEQDRLLTADRQVVTLPVLETGRSDRRLVAIENAGRDEVLIDEKATTGLNPINRQEQSWRDLATVLGEHVTQAFAARDDASEPSLTFMTLKRQEAERAGARIGLATTLLVVDASGAYRALVQYRLANATEQFLQLSLPSGARLWTAVVAGEPVKPAQAVPHQPGIVRIPLVKTATGEGDYLVELKYGGRMPMTSGLGAAQFPLIRVTSVNIELSQLRLLLPESRQWFNFQGTMRRVVDEAELFQGFQSYLNKRIQDAALALSSSNDYTKIRATINLKESRALLENSRSFNANGAWSQAGFPADGYFATNSGLLSRAEQQVHVEFSGQQREHFDNRERLNQYFGRQNVERAKNVVSQLGSNFDAAQPETEKSMVGDTVNEQFFFQNQLRTDSVAADAEAKMADKSGRKSTPIGANMAGKAINSRDLRGARPAENEKQTQAIDARPEKAKLPAIAAKKELDDLQRRLADESNNEELRRRAGGEGGEQLQKYRMNLEQNLARGQQASQGQQLQPGTELPSQQNAFGSRAPRGGTIPGGEGTGSGANRGEFGGGLATSGMGGQQQSNAPAIPGGIPMPGGAPAAAPPGAPVPAATPSLTADFDSLAEPRGEQLAQLAAGLASLDVQIPERGRVYRFTTPRGEIALTANSIKLDALSRLLGLASVFVVSLIGWFLSREKGQQMLKQLLNSVIVGVALAMLGFASVFSGFLPFAGILVTVMGIVILIRSRTTSMRAAVQ